MIIHDSAFACQQKNTAFFSFPYRKTQVFAEVSLQTALFALYGSLLRSLSTIRRRAGGACPAVSIPPAILERQRWNLSPVILERSQKAQR